VCDTTLIYSEETDYTEYGGGRMMTTLQCERCSVKRAALEGTKEYALARVERQIDRAIRVGDWKKIVARKPTSAKRPA
jgi:C4-type Zn-finger protein